MSLKKLIAAYLQDALTLQIATSKGTKPWICTVNFAYDTDFNMYWFSRRATRHSKEIARNANVAGAIVAPRKKNEKVRGLQCSGTAQEVRDEKEIKHGVRVMSQRYAVSKERQKELLSELHEGVDYALYRLRPDSIMLYDTEHFPKDPRQEYIVPVKDMVQPRVPVRR